MTCCSRGTLRRSGSPRAVLPRGSSVERGRGGMDRRASRPHSVSIPHVRVRTTRSICAARAESRNRRRLLPAQRATASAGVSHSGAIALHLSLGRPAKPRVARTSPAESPEAGSSPPNPEAAPSSCPRCPRTPCRGPAPGRRCCPYRSRSCGRLRARELDGRCHLPLPNTLAALRASSAHTPQKKATILAPPMPAADRSRRRNAPPPGGKTYACRQQCEQDSVGCKSP